MLRTVLILNLLCLGAVLLVLQRLRRPAALGDSIESFAHVLAAATPITRRLADCNTWNPTPHLPVASAPEGHPSAPQEQNDDPHEPEGAVATEEELGRNLTLADRLALLRCMLQGQSAADAAAEVGVPLAAARALYRTHGRQEVARC